MDGTPKEDLPLSDWWPAFDQLLEGSNTIPAFDAATDGLSSGMSTTAFSGRNAGGVSVPSWWAQLLMKHLPVPSSFHTRGSVAHTKCPCEPLKVLSACSGICSEAECLKVSWHHRGERWDNMCSHGVYVYMFCHR